MAEMATVVAQWALDLRQVRDRRYRAPTPRERERWHALWLLAQGWSANTVANRLERDAHTSGGGLAAFAQEGPAALACEQTGGPPPPATRRRRRGCGSRCRPPRRRSAAPWRIGTGRWCANASRRAAGSGSAAAPARAPCTGWALPSSAPRSACSRPTRGNAPPSCRSTSPCWRRPGRRGRRSSSRTRPTSGPTRTCMGSGCARAARRWSTPPARAGASRPATTRPSAWRPGRSSTWH